jgi:hypothetical protein
MEQPAPKVTEVPADSARGSRLVTYALLLVGAVRKWTPDLNLLRPHQLKEGLHRVAGWAHVLAALPPLAADFVKPLAPHGSLWWLAVPVAALAALLIAAKALKLAADTASAIVVFFIAATLYSLCVIALEGRADDPKGALAHWIPGVEKIQESLLRIEAKVDAVKEDTAAILKAQQEEKARGEARQAELKRVLADAAGGGATSVKAVTEIRDLLRPGIPDIDNYSADLLPGLVRRTLDELQKPGANPNDFSGAVKQALAQAQASAADLKFADAAKVLDAALANAQAEDQERGRGRAALLAERGRVAGL